MIVTTERGVGERGGGEGGGGGGKLITETKVCTVRKHREQLNQICPYFENNTICILFKFLLINYVCNWMQLRGAPPTPPILHT